MVVSERAIEEALTVDGRKGEKVGRSLRPQYPRLGYTASDLASSSSSTRSSGDLSIS